MLNKMIKAFFPIICDPKIDKIQLCRHPICIALNIVNMKHMNLMHRGFRKQWVKLKQQSLKLQPKQISSSSQLFKASKTVVFTTQVEFCVITTLHI